MRDVRGIVYAEIGTAVSYTYVIYHIFYVQVHIGLQPSSCANLCLRLLDHRPYPCILRLDIEEKNCQRLSKIVKFVKSVWAAKNPF